MPFQALLASYYDALGSALIYFPIAIFSPPFKSLSELNDL
nr:MAG TPA: hypothetical protein [Caudoviricetes sp.]